MTSIASPECERFTGRAKAVVEEHVVAAAHGLGHKYLGTEHLLLALLGGVGGLAADILAERDVDHPKVRAQVIELLSGYTAS